MIVRYSSNAGHHVDVQGAQWESSLYCCFAGEEAGNPVLRCLGCGLCHAECSTRTQINVADKICNTFLYLLGIHRKITENAIEIDGDILKANQLQMIHGCALTHGYVQIL